MSRELWETAECSDPLAHLEVERHARAWCQEADDAADMVTGAVVLVCLVLAGTYVLFGGWVLVTALLAGYIGIYGLLALGNIVSLCSRGRPLLAMGDKAFPAVPPVHECGAADETEVR